MPDRSYVTSGTVIPMDDKCSASFISRTRPEAASNALEGTQPRLTQVLSKKKREEERRERGKK